MVEGVAVVKRLTEIKSDKKMIQVLGKMYTVSVGPVALVDVRGFV